MWAFRLRENEWRRQKDEQKNICVTIYRTQSMLTYWACGLVQFHIFHFSISLSHTQIKARARTHKHTLYLTLEFMIYTHINFKWIRKHVLYSICKEGELASEREKKQPKWPQNNLHKWKRFRIVTLTLTVFGVKFTKYFWPFWLFDLCSFAI